MIMATALTVHFRFAAPGRPTFASVQDLGAVGYAHRREHFPARKIECSRAAEPVKATSLREARDAALTEPAAFHRGFPPGRKMPGFSWEILTRISVVVYC
jgi:hypothetical protein